MRSDDFKASALYSVAINKSQEFLASKIEEKESTIPRALGRKSNKIIITH